MWSQSENTGCHEEPHHPTASSLFDFFHNSATNFISLLTKDKSQKSSNYNRWKAAAVRYTCCGFWWWFYSNKCNQTVFQSITVVVERWPHFLTYLHLNHNSWCNVPLVSARCNSSLNPSKHQLIYTESAASLANVGLSAWLITHVRAV